LPVGAEDTSAGVSASAGTAVGTDPPVLLSLTGVAVAELPQATINTKANIIATGQYLNTVFLKTCEVDMFNLLKQKLFGILGYVKLLSRMNLSINCAGQTRFSMGNMACGRIPLTPNG
jgi:hypothetical protein